MDSDKAAPRPIAHDVMLRTVQELGAKIERVEDVPLGGACVLRRCGAGLRGRLMSLRDAMGDGDAAESRAREIKIDARPSDALALVALERPHLR